MTKNFDAAIAIIFDSAGKILLAKRFEPKNTLTHNKWQFPGGGIEKGETKRKAVIREVMEEASIKVKLLTRSPIKRIETRKAKRTITITLYGFPAQYLSGKISCENDPESSDIKWFNYKDIDFSKTLPGTKELIDESIKICKNL